jgi:hypothetical protein
MIPRPRTEGGSLCSTPSAAVSINLLGGHRCEGVAISRDQLRALERLYEFDLAGSVEKARAHAQKAHDAAIANYEAAKAKCGPWDRPPELPQPLNLDAAAKLHGGRDIRNLMRHAEADGMRLIAAIARHLSPGDDPVRLLLSLMAQAGFDVTEDPGWYDGDGSDYGDDAESEP